MPAERSFLLLHGFGNHRPPEHWQYWLAGQLRAAGVPVVYPQLPDPDTPTFDGWLAALAEHLGELADLGAAERIVLCHSLSCVLWLRAASEGQIPAALAPDRLVLVSPPALDRLPPRAVGFGRGAVDAEKLRASATQEIRFVGSEGDEYNPVGVNATYAEPLGLAFDLIPGAGHISASDGYGPWPAILAWCESPGGPIGHEAAS
jgi:predicted alpha/beta hydrolase family esterase